MDREHLADLTLFVRTAELGSFSAAAKMVGLTPSAISKAMARLERELGCRLLNRSSRSMTLSDEGARLYENCRLHLAGMEEAWAEASNAASHPCGRLRVAVPLTFGERLLAPALPAFLRSHPDVSLEAVFIDRQVDLVEERFEAAIRLGPPPDSRVVAVQLSPHRFVTCASPAYLSAHGTPQSIEELAVHNCLAYVFSGRNEVRRWHFARDGRSMEFRPRGNIALDNAAALLEAAVQGIGIFQGPTYLLSDALKRGSLVPLFTDHTSFGPPLNLLMPPAKRRPARVEAFARFMQVLCRRHDSQPVG